MFGFGDKANTNRLTIDETMPESLLDTAVQGVIGLPLDRVDGPLKVSGKATYAAEYQIDDLAYGVLVGARSGAGKIKPFDASPIEAMPGVIAVVTDYPTFLRNSQQGGETKSPTQGVEKVAYWGEPVAIVVAEQFEQARDAAQRLEAMIEYEPREGRFSFNAYREDTKKPPFNNIPSHSKQGDVEKAFAAAPVMIDATYTTPSQNSAAMEPHASLAVWADGKLTLYGSYQMPSSDAQQLADALGLGASKVRIIASYIGGGFGSKLGIAPESVAAAVASRQIGRPVKCVMARQQVFDATVRRSNTEQRIRLGADAGGLIDAIAHETLTSNLPGETYFEPAGISTHFLYRGENRLITHDLVELDWMLSGSMRAPGEAVGMIALECTMDELAEQIDLDPIELRRRNEPPVDPEKDIPFSSRRLVDCMTEGARLFGWERRSKPASDRRGEWWHGIGMAAAARGNQLMKSSAKVSVDGQGRATVETAMTDIGTGSYTILAQITAELLGLPIGDVTVKLGDTAMPEAAGSGGSWGAGSAGSAVYLACQLLRDQIGKTLGQAGDTLTMKDGQVIAGNRSIPIAELAGDGIEAIGEVSPGKQEKLFTQASYGAHFCEVAINAVTGEVRVQRMLGVFSCGRVLNEKTARSQCLGGMTFGIGAALTEEIIHDPRNGKVVNHDLAEYHVPVNADVPQLEVHFLPERDRHANPIHAKGLGELGISGAAAAIANAIYNACGVRVRDFPLTIDKIVDYLPQS